MSQYKALIIYSISNDQSKKSFEEELEKYGLERLGEQNIFVLPLEEYRTKVQAFKAYLRVYSRKLIPVSIWTARTQSCLWNHV